MINITADSRQIKKGDIFVAINGFSSDGHDYIDRAISNGASKIIAEKGTYDIEYEIVEDSRLYLENYLKENYNDKYKNMKIVGITGTNGKTTTAFLIYQALRKLGIKAGYIGTIGFYLEDKVRPLSNTCPDVWDLYRLFDEAYEEGCEYVIQEVSSHALSFKRVNTYDFDYAMFTNLTQDHLDYHKTMENYALAKQELFRKVKENNKCFINIDDEYKDYYLLESNNNITYGFSDSNYMVTNYKLNPASTIITIKIKGTEYDFISNLIGKYNIYNMLLTIAFLTEINIPIEKVKSVVKEIKSPPGRMDIIKYHNNTIVIDYAHTPDAIQNIIDTVKETSNGNIYTVFGCTGDRDRLKRPIMFDIISSSSKKVIITNDDPHFEDEYHIVNDILENNKRDNYEIELDRKEAIIKGIKMLENNDILLILGKGHEEFMVIGNNKIPCNDRNIVNEFIEI